MVVSLSICKSCILWINQTHELLQIWTVLQLWADLLPKFSFIYCSSNIVTLCSPYYLSRWGCWKEIISLTFKSCSSSYDLSLEACGIKWNSSTEWCEYIQLWNHISSHKSLHQCTKKSSNVSRVSWGTNTHSSSWMIPSDCEHSPINFIYWVKHIMSQLISYLS